MASYFECTTGCTNCCPRELRKDEHNIYVNATLGDVYRAFVFDNPDKKSFSEVFRQQFGFGATRPTDTKAPELDKELMKLVYRVIPIFSNDTFVLAPTAKYPCHNLTATGCRSHDKITKYLCCACSPESKLMDDDTEHDLEKWGYIMEIFPCLINCTLDRNQRKRTMSLSKLHDDEIRLTHRIFPHMRVSEMDNSNPVYLGDIEDDSSGEMLKTVQSLDDSANRSWEPEVIESTIKYAKIMGIKLNAFPR
jgi:hypothetical protein